MSAVLNYWDLARVEGITGSKGNEDEDFFNVALACEDGQWSWAHKTVLSGGSTFIEFALYFIMVQYHPLVLLCMIYSEQQLESGCSIVYNGPDIMGDEDENLAEDSAVGKPWVIVIDQWSGASERLVSWILEWSSDAWCLMCSWNVNIANLKRVCWWTVEWNSDALYVKGSWNVNITNVKRVCWWTVEWSSDALYLKCSWNVNITNLKRVCWWPAELSSVWCAWCYHGMGILQTQSNSRTGRTERGAWCEHWKRPLQPKISFMGEYKCLRFLALNVTIEWEEKRNPKVSAGERAWLEKILYANIWAGID